MMLLLMMRMLMILTGSDVSGSGRRAGSDVSWSGQGVGRGLDTAGRHASLLLAA
jgi:hypothetical protein